MDGNVTYSQSGSFPPGGLRELAHASGLGGLFLGAVGSLIITGSWDTPSLASCSGLYLSFKDVFRFMTDLLLVLFRALHEFLLYHGLMLFPILRLSED